MTASTQGRAGRTPAPAGFGGGYPGFQASFGAQSPPHQGPGAASGAFRGPLPPRWRRSLQTRGTGMSRRSPRWLFWGHDSDALPGNLL